MAKGHLAKRAILGHFWVCLLLFAIVTSFFFCLTQHFLFKSSTRLQLFKDHLRLFKEDKLAGRRLNSVSISHADCRRNCSRKDHNLTRALYNSFVAATRLSRDRKSHNLSTCVVDPAVIDCHGMGFASFMLTTLELISVCGALGSAYPTVMWRNCKLAGCSFDSNINSWERYFEPVNPKVMSKASKILCVNHAVIEDIGPGDFKGGYSLQGLSILNNSFRNRSRVRGFESNRIITLEERCRVNQLLRRYVTPKAKLRRKVETFYQKYLDGYNLLAVHVRGTDHWMETESRKLPALSKWITSASFVLESLPHPRKIFVATDNNEAIVKFVTHFGSNTVAFTKAERTKAYNGNPLHYANKNQVDSTILASQVLVDILLLAKCDHFLHAESSVASLASYFNPHMKSHFLYEIVDKAKGNVAASHKSATAKEMEGVTSLSHDDNDDDNDDDVGVVSDDADEDVRYLSDSVNCFQMNSPNSVCPNTAKGVFVSINEAAQFLRF